METISVTTHKVYKIGLDQERIHNDVLAIEEPLEIRIRYTLDGTQKTKSISVTMRTPGNDSELALGFLFTEGIIKNINQISDIQPDPFDNNIITVVSEMNFVPQLSSSDRNFYTTSSCGVCGKSSIDSIRSHSIFHNINSGITISSGVLLSLKDKLFSQQEIFEHTGGIHASAIFSKTGDLLLLREDVGRHNALDKIIGTGLVRDILPFSESILLLSGRASFELLQKAYMAGIKIVAAIGAPSSLAVQAAEEFDITLVGFLKRDGFNIYTNSHRILRG